jgi:AcrR family transcriptional regulator
MELRKVADGRKNAEVRDRILQTACTLFYKNGVRAVGIDLVIEKAGVAKTSLYRHFSTKDDLIAAFLEREDEDFWKQWDGVAAQHAADPFAEIDAHMVWIGERVSRDNYRGCPQINVAAEFPEASHPARKVAADHKRNMRQKLQDIVMRMGIAQPNEVAGQLSLLINGAFVSSQILEPGEAVTLLQHAAITLIGGSKSRKRSDSTRVSPVKSASHRKRWIASGPRRPTK